MPRDNWEMPLLLKVFSDLEDFLPYLILVGGWVPFIYSRYLWRIKQEPPQTMDIDFGFKNASFKGLETIAERVIKKNYGEHHVRLGHDVPFVPIVDLGQGKARAEVEFITSPQTTAETRERLIGREILVNEIPNFDVLLERTFQVKIEGYQVAIPRPSGFVFHKLLSFEQRMEEAKKRKDLYAAYYTLLFCPDKNKLNDDIRRWMDTHPLGEQVASIIKSAFSDPYAAGPTLIAEASATTSVATLVPDVRKDAHKRFRFLLG
ncbi:MAG: nucleotidyltransferase domain-containing protein [Elusimicrobia bacterium]|nr:nucleotidyltransferase domain-containing protein [Candidatus Obscuribacterium magneticum]